MSSAKFGFTDGGSFAEAMLSGLRKFVADSELSRRLGLTIESAEAGDNPFIPSIEVRMRVTKPNVGKRPSNVKFRAVGAPIIHFTLVSTVSTEQNIMNLENFITARLDKPMVVPEVIRKGRTVARAFNAAT